MKKISIILALIFLFSACACSATGSILKGDVNENGKIDMTDYILVKRNYFGTFQFDDSQLKIGDCNKNGKIDMTDYILIKRAYFGTYDLGIDDSGNIETPDNSVTPEVSVPQENPTYSETIDRLLGNTANREMNKKNILSGKSYTLSMSAHSNYPDNNKILTDGIKPMSFSSDGKWAGFVLNKGAKLNIIVNLGKTEKNIMDLSVRALNMEEYGIHAPKSVSVYVAGEDENYILVGRSYRPDGELSKNAHRDYSVFLQGSVEAKYIRFEIEANKGGWYFIGEVFAMAYSDAYSKYSTTGSSLNDYYEFEGIPQIEAEEYWTDCDDYDTVQNLISKKAAYIAATDYVDPSHVTQWYNTKNTSILTDGRKAVMNNIGDAAWFHITQGVSREITYDLEKISAISGFSAGFLYDASAGVQYPLNVKIKLSTDGRNWQTVYKCTDAYADLEEESYRYEVDFDKEYKARYFQVTFNVNGHTYIDEIVAKGRKNASQALDLIADPKEEEIIHYDGFIKPEEFCDVNNMLLSYHCILDKEGNFTEDGLITEEEYLPHVAYLDKDGNIKDTFFDSYLYLPYTSLVHGAGSNYGRSAEGWRAYVDNIYYEGRNMDALEACAERVYGELNITDQKLKVFTSILYTFPKLHDGSKNPFGDIDGDGISEDFSKIEDRKKAIKWIMDAEVEGFKAKNYDNLEFCGFYWFEEGVTYADPHETQLIKFAVDYAHELGYKIFWIPYFSAAGVKDWAKLGFDAACLQPNYMFNDISADILYEAAKRANDLGMCVELEYNNPENLHEAKKYMEYLIAGYNTGYMNSVKMYYQSGVPGAFYTACYSDNPDARITYDATYEFAKGTFDPITPDEVIISESDVNFEYKPGASFEGKIDISHLKDISGDVAITLSPKYGSVKLNRDGSFFYFPAQDFEGDDSFEIIFDLGYGEPISTKINLIASK